MTKLEELEQTAKELLAEIEELKATACGVANHNMDFNDIQIDLNNTWCEATEENYMALVELGYLQVGYENKIATLNSDYLIPIFTPAGARVKGSICNNGRKQIHLVNGKFEFVKTELETMKEKFESGEYIVLWKPKNTNTWFFPDDVSVGFMSYNDYKLIHKKHADILDAYLKDNSVEIEMETVYQSGIFKICDFINDYNVMNVYRLKPKQWYEIESNFPCLVINKDNPKERLYVNKHEYTKENNTNWLVFEYMSEDIYSLNCLYYRPATKEEVLSLLGGGIK